MGNACKGARAALFCQGRDAAGALVPLARTCERLRAFADAARSGAQPQPQA